MHIENEYYRVEVDAKNGVITSLYVKQYGFDLIGESRLASYFRLCAPREDYLCNYIDGAAQSAGSVKMEESRITILFPEMTSELGKLDIELEYAITLKEDYVSFSARLVNNSLLKISEFWYPRIGGMTEFCAGKEAKLFIPGYQTINEYTLFNNFAGRKGLGAEAPECTTDYPGKMMPWWDLYDEKSDCGLYLGYHDEIFRYSSWHTYLWPNTTRHNGTWPTPEEAGSPVGVVFSHVRYPYIACGESFESGEFILRAHKGDWHKGSLFYRKWFMEKFPFDKTASWLRKESAWFTSIIYQPEDRVVTDYEGYAKWCEDAREYGINCCELLGWDKGGIERDYPRYVPEEKFGGREAFRSLMKKIDGMGSKCLAFVNYNILDGSTKWFEEELCQYRHRDEFGQTPNWMAWGESTLLARKNISVRRHLLASVLPQMEEILEKQFLKLVEDGAHGLQIDKLCVGSTLDFNPLNTEKPDVVMCEGLVRAIERLLEKCRKIDPSFCIAAEAVQDRLIPYIDVYYRNSNAHHISPLRYVFPEWTACQHVCTAHDYIGINGAVLTGSVICVEPETYSASVKNPLWVRTAEYIREVERIRKELLDIIFLGNYYDNLDAVITEEKKESKEPATGKKELTVGGEVMIPGGGGVAAAVSTVNSLHFKVHGNRETGKRAIAVMNPTEAEIRYTWKFMHRDVTKARLYEPFKPVRVIGQGELLVVKGEGLQIIVEEDT